MPRRSRLVLGSSSLHGQKYLLTLSESRSLSLNQSLQSKYEPYGIDFQTYPLLIYILAYSAMDTAPKSKNSAMGIVVEALPDTLFRVKIEGAEDPILAYLAGKMRMNRIRVLIGDKVELEQDPYGGRARITRRL